MTMLPTCSKYQYNCAFLQRVVMTMLPTCSKYQYNCAFLQRVVMTLLPMFITKITVPFSSILWSQCCLLAACSQYKCVFIQRVVIAMLPTYSKLLPYSMACCHHISAHFQPGNGPTLTLFTSSEGGTRCKNNASQFE